MIRDQQWLESLLKNIWHEHFHDIEIHAPLKIQFGRRARNRLGSISYNHQQKFAVIRLTGLFKDTNIPVMVISATIVHELCHYAHGFAGGNERKHALPHKGGVIRREFAERGLEDLYLAQKRWLNANWPKIIKKYYPHLQFRGTRHSRTF